jgi:hypothetical protein
MVPTAPGWSCAAIRHLVLQQLSVITYQALDAALEGHNPGPVVFGIQLTRDAICTRSDRGTFYSRHEKVQGETWNQV